MVSIEPEVLKVSMMRSLQLSVGMSDLLGALRWPSPIFPSGPNSLSLPCSSASASSYCGPQHHLLGDNGSSLMAGEAMVMV